MTKGVLVFARNNESIDYIKQAKFLAKRAKQYLGLPTTLVTDKELDDDTFDNIIVETKEYQYTSKGYNNGISSTVLTFKNSRRSMSYDLSPYDETIVLDSDILICDKTYLNCFEQQEDFLCYKDSYDLGQLRNYHEFDKINDSSVDFYWATCLFFRKTKTNKIFFNLIKHIEDHYNHYRLLYNIQSQTFRNDFAFSIAIHIMNGHQKGTFAGAMPGKLYYTTDKDVLLNIKDDSCMFLLENPDTNLFTPLRTKGITVHAMNKFSLQDVL